MAQTHDDAGSREFERLAGQLDLGPPVVLLPQIQRDVVWTVDQTSAGLIRAGPIDAEASPQLASSALRVPDGRTPP